MEYNYLLPKKKEEEEEGEMLMFLCLFFLTERPLYSSLVEEENINSIKQGSKTGGKNHGIGEDNDVNGGVPSQRGINLAVTPKIREVEKAFFWDAITQIIK